MGAATIALDTTNSVPPALYYVSARPQGFSIATERAYPVHKSYKKLLGETDAAAKSGLTCVDALPLYRIGAGNIDSGWRSHSP